MSETFISEIIEAVAEADDVSPTELDFLLYDHIDLEALNQLKQHDNSAWELTFEVPEHSVTVTSDGSILVDGWSKNNHLID